MGDNNNNKVKVPVKMKRVVSICLSVGLRVEFLLKTESGYLRDAEVT